MGILVRWRILLKKVLVAAVNLGDDTDTTAAIYGQLAGAYYGYANLPSDWVQQIYAKKFIEILSKWITYEGQRWQSKKASLPTNHITLIPEHNSHLRATIPQKSNSSLHSTDVHKEEIIYPLTLPVRFEGSINNESGFHKKSEVFHTIPIIRQPISTSNSTYFGNNITIEKKQESPLIDTSSSYRSNANYRSTDKRK